MTTHRNGVNLGGWLVLEKWMTPGVFAGTDAKDEFTFMQTPDAATKIDAHRKSFIDEDDFEWLAAHGIDTVRIPVGYWLLDGEPPYVSGSSYLDRAFEMAMKYEIKVLLDIHGLPGSQNGNDHSGKIGPAMWQKDARFRKQSLNYVKTFATRYGQHPSLWGLQIINEPNPAAFNVALRRYYSRAYRMLNGILPPAVKIIYADAWSPRIFAFALLGKRRAVMDVHLYHMATIGAKTHDIDWYYRKLERRARYLRVLSRIHPIIIGEWSGVITGEVLNKLPQPERAPEELRHYKKQAQLYATLAGSFYWSYKLEGSGLNFWSYRSIVENQDL